MPTRLHAFSRPERIPSVQFLFLSEGFSNNLQFLQHVYGIFQAFLTIDPFEQARNEFAAWAHFVPSVDGPINDAEQNTAFGFFVSEGGTLTTLRPQRLVDVISDLQVSVPHIDDPLEFIDGDGVWLDRLVSQESIVCVLVNNPNQTSTTNFEWPQGLLDPPALTPKIQGLLPCIFLSSWVLTQGNASQYTNPHFAVALTLAKQIGLLLGLADEKELPEPKYEQYLTKDPLDSTIILEPSEPNVTAYGSLLDSTGQSQIARLKWLKWKEMIPAHRRTGFSVAKHPVSPPGATDAEIQKLFEDTARLGDASVLLLRHPNLADPSLEGPNLQRYVDGPRKPLLLDGQVNLFEGAAGYRQGLYRSSSECLMRFEGYDTNEGTAVTRNAVPFCKVCHEHIQRAIAGFGEFTINFVKIKPGLVDRCPRRHESRVADAMLQYIENETPADGVMRRPSGVEMTCTEATARRFEGLFNDKFLWDPTRRVPAGNWDPNHLQLPFRLGIRSSPRDSRRAWAVWNTVLRPSVRPERDPDEPPIRHALSRWNSAQYAGLGAAGAVVYLGFGCLVNRQIRRRMMINDPELGGDIEIWYNDVVPLTVNDFNDIQPGAILQIWRGQGANHNERLNNARETFRNIIAYVKRSQLRREERPRLDPTDKPTSQELCGFPRWCGHSLYFVHKGENGPPMIADQYGIRHSLLDSYPRYSFWIAAQWFDATGVTLL